jgi:hypothetical protein
MTPVSLLPMMGFERYGYPIRKLNKNVFFLEKTSQNQYKGDQTVMVEKEFITLSDEKVIEKLIEDDNIAINHMVLRKSKHFPSTIQIPMYI